MSLNPNRRMVLVAFQHGADEESRSYFNEPEYTHADCEPPPAVTINHQGQTIDIEEPQPPSGRRLPVHTISTLTSDSHRFRMVQM